MQKDSILVEKELISDVSINGVVMRTRHLARYWEKASPVRGRIRRNHSAQRIAPAGTYSVV
jgi:hypothetical protein